MNKEDAFHLPRKMDSIEGLLAFEGQVEIAAGDVAESTVRLAYHVHMILQYQLWRHVTLDDGKTPAFGTQYEYLDYLAGKIYAGTSTMKAYHVAVRLAKFLDYSVDNIQVRGVSIFSEVCRRVIFDRITGEPVALKSGKVPDGYEIKGYLREVIDEVGPSDSHEMRLRGGDIRKELDAKLLRNRPSIDFDIPDGRYPEIVTWHVELRKDDMLVDIPGNHSRISKDAPDYVLEAWYKRVGCGWRLRDE
jgi:hypothetical protein